jgi:hypothetical protein
MIGFLPPPSRHIDGSPGNSVGMEPLFMRFILMASEQC